MMQDEARELYPLDDRQRAVATAPASQCQLVLSSPGTGKTHTVVARLNYLITTEGLKAGEILVLCFSRAAVREVASRVERLVGDRLLHDDLRFVMVRTFDSFATRLLLEADPDEALPDEGYDARIERAAKALESPAGRASRIAARVKHLIVDEIQDLVGVRAELVRQLLLRISGGFTLLGDPAQAIYGFSVQGQDDAITPAELLKWVRSQPWASALLETEMETNYRSQGQSARIARDLRGTILAASEDDGEPLRRLREVVGELEACGSARDPNGLKGNAGGRSVAVLCRTNGEVLQVASLFAGAEMPFSMRARLEDQALPAWIARIFAEWTKPGIREDEFIERWEARVGELEGIDPRRAWRWIKTVEGRDDRDLRLASLRAALRKGHRLPDEADAYARDSANLVSLSTIHSAKGREFDQVVILEPGGSEGEGASPLEEARVLYVAATRARGELLKLGRAGIAEVWKVDSGDGRQRWVAKHPLARQYFFEIGCEGDFQPESPVSEYVYENRAGAEQTQEYLWSSVKPGDTVDIQKEIRKRYAFYDVKHKANQDAPYVTVGQLSLNFKYEMKEVLSSVSGSSSNAYPTCLKGIRVVALTTEVIGPQVEHIHQPYLATGFCLGLRLRGMGYLCTKQGR